MSDETERAIELAKETKAIEQAVRTGNSQEWPDVIPFQKYNLPKFPTHVLSPGIQECVEAMAVATQTPADLAAFSAIAALSTAIQRKIEIIVREGWVEPLNIYNAVVLEPGTRKSAVHETVAGRPVHEHEFSEKERLGPSIFEAQTEYRIKQKQLEVLEKEAAKAKDLNKMMDLNQRARTLAKELSDTKPPALPRLVTSDATTEALAQLMDIHDEKMTVLSTEGDLFAVMAGRYSRGVPNFDLHLKAYSGDTVHVDRKSGTPITLERPCLTMGMTIQPSVLQDLSQTPQFNGKGLIARFIWAMPPSPLGYRNTNPPAVSPHILNSYYEMVRRLLAIEPQCPDRKKIAPYYSRLSSEAYAVFDNFHKLIESRMRPEEELAGIRYWAAKLMGNIARIAAQFHMADYYEHGAPWQTEVSADTVRRAIEVGEYLIPHAQAVHGMMKADPLVENAKHLLKHIKQLGKESFTKNELYQKVKGSGRFDRVDALEEILLLLCRHFYIRESYIEREPKPGRPISQRYEVNPKFLKGSDYGDDDSSPLDHIPSAPVNGFEDKKDESGNTSKHITVPQPMPSTEAKTAPEQIHSNFPLYGKSHDHEFAMVVGPGGTHLRCKYCGEFLQKGGGSRVQ